MWLTQEELDALLRASTNMGVRLSSRMAGAIVPKLQTARDALGCPVPPQRRPRPGSPAAGMLQSLPARKEQ